VDKSLRAIQDAARLQITQRKLAVLLAPDVFTAG
jgi:hypothetical protein